MYAVFLPPHSGTKDFAYLWVQTICHLGKASHLWWSKETAWLLFFTQLGDHGELHEKQCSRENGIPLHHAERLNAASPVHLLADADWPTADKLQLRTVTYSCKLKFSFVSFLVLTRRRTYRRWNSQLSEWTSATANGWTTCWWRRTQSVP